MAGSAPRYFTIAITIASDGTVPIESTELPNEGVHRVQIVRSLSLPPFAPVRWNRKAHRTVSDLPARRALLPVLASLASELEREVEQDATVYLLDQSIGYGSAYFSQTSAQLREHDVVAWAGSVLPYRQGCALLPERYVGPGDTLTTSAALDLPEVGFVAMRWTSFVHAVSCGAALDMESRWWPAIYDDLHLAAAISEAGLSAIRPPGTIASTIDSKGWTPAIGPVDHRYEATRLIAHALLFGTPRDEGRGEGCLEPDPSAAIPVTEGFASLLAAKLHGIGAEIEAASRWRDQTLAERRDSTPLAARGIPFPDERARDPERAARAHRQYATPITRDGYVTACVASYPARRDALVRTVETILPQVDVLRVYLNDYDEVPAPLHHPRIEIARSQDYRDLKATGKVWRIEHAPDGYVLTIDDDALYPPDYVDRYVATLRKYDHRIMLTTHGSIVPESARWYYQRTSVYGFRQALAYDAVVNLAGSGSIGYHTSRFKPRFEHFSPHVAVDLVFSFLAREAGLPIIALRRPKGWITVQRETEGQGLYQDYVQRPTIHTAYTLNNDLWSPDAARDRYSELVASLFGTVTDHEAERLELDRNMLEAARLGCVAGPWSAHGNAAVQTVSRFVDYTLAGAEIVNRTISAPSSNDPERVLCRLREDLRAGAPTNRPSAHYRALGIAARRAYKRNQDAFRQLRGVERSKALRLSGSVLRMGQRVKAWRGTLSGRAFGRWRRGEDSNPRYP